MHVDTSSHKLKVDQKFVGWIWSKNGCGQSGHRTLKLTVPQELTDGMNWYFAYWCKVKKVKSYFNDFWVGMVKNGCSDLDHEALKSAVSKEWVYDIFLHVHTNSYKLKVDQENFGWTWSKMGVVSLVTGLWDWLISRINWWNKLIFYIMVQIQES